MSRTASLLLLAACIATTGATWARSADRNQPMDIEAGRQEGTFESDSVNTLSGGVTITQGSLDIRAARAEITLSGGDPARAVLTGAPVVLRQQMDDGTPLTAHAAKIDYNLRSEVVVFTGDVRIEQPRGTLRGERVVYNLQTGRVESGGEGSGRVRMRILPRNTQDAAPAQPAKPAAADARDDG